MSREVGMCRGWWFVKGVPIPSGHGTSRKGEKLGHWEITRYGRQVDGTHLTGMLSCLLSEKSLTSMCNGKNNAILSKICNSKYGGMQLGKFGSESDTNLSDSVRRHKSKNSGGNFFKTEICSWSFFKVLKLSGSHWPS